MIFVALDGFENMLENLTFVNTMKLKAYKNEKHTINSNSYIFKYIFL